MCFLRNLALLGARVRVGGKRGGSISGAGLAGRKAKADWADYTSLQRCHLMVLVAILLLSLLVAGCCGNLENGQSSDPERFKRAVCNAVCDLQTLAPAVGAGILCWTSA